MKAIIVGGSSGMGLAAARRIAVGGGSVLLASRDNEKLIRAAESIKESVGSGPGEVAIKTMDMTREDEVESFFGSLPQDSFNHLVISAAGRSYHKPFVEADTGEFQNFFQSKFWGPMYCARYGASRLKRPGSIVFFSGLLSRRPGVNCSPLAATNGAIEALTRSLALELGPDLRVNCLSPGFVDTERFDHLDPETKTAMLETTGASLPLGRVGRSEEIGHAVEYLLGNTFTTGVILDVDGGHQVRQYASQRKDPFRKTDTKVGVDDVSSLQS